MKINVKVKTNSKEQRIIKENENNYIVFLKKQPIDGKANKELLKLLTKYFKSNVLLLRGERVKNKVLEVI
ncbi:MAG: DUF167 domain-containing protein [Candidatus Nanoarchaeia archaeon]|jgi:hypothetical protein|nr:DUF167 domain-containing protein [Candidatus Nanoarchaeia archaeon]MDD4563487.1 DUF167 domain-containing protein [Candidatus Nanoarchaeia archaeon]